MSESPAVDGERCLNLYPEIVESGHGKGPIALYRTPGLSLFTTLPKMPVQGMIATDDVWYVMAGGSLYLVAADGSFTALGDTGIVTPGKNAILSTNGIQIGVSFEGQFFVYDPNTTTFFQPAVVPQLTSVSNTVLDGYMITANLHSRVWNVSNAFDATTWDPLQFVLWQQPDNLVAVVAGFQELWIFGSQHIEIWYDAGTFPFPFQRVQGGVLDQGCAAPATPTKLDNTIFWLGADSRGRCVAWRANGWTPQRVSNHAVESQWNKYPSVGNAVGWSYQEEGHSFYVLWFPSGGPPSAPTNGRGATWVYDVATSWWHERSWQNPADNADEAHLGSCHAFVFGQHMVGDRSSGKIYVQSIEGKFTDNGNLIKRLRSCPHISTEMRWYKFGKLLVDMQVAGGLPGGIPSTGQGSNPLVMLRVSDDGGFTWSNIRTASAGKVGEYLTRVQWYQLGRSMNRVYEVSITDPIDVAFIDAYSKSTPGTGA